MHERTMGALAAERLHSLREALAARPLLGFETAGWAGASGTASAKPAFVGTTSYTYTESAGVTSSGLVLSSVQFSPTSFGGQSDAVFSGGATIATTLISGGHELVFAGGTASGTVASGGGYQYVSGGSAIGTILVGSGGDQTVYSGMASGTVVSSGGIEFVSGGIARGTVVSSGGSQILSGGTASGTVVSSGGIQNVFNGTAVGTMVSNGGSEIVSGGTARGSVIRSGGTEVVSSFSSEVGATVASGGTLTAGSFGFVTGTTVSSGGLEVVAAGGMVNSTTFAAGGQLELASLSYGADEIAAISSSGVLTVTSGGNVVYTQQLGSADIGYQAIVTSGPGNTPLVTLVCFASGTLIRTARGQVAVEALRIGDLAVTASDEHRPITWIGHRRLDGPQDDGRRILPHDQQPIRIRQGAFGRDACGHDLPRRDLLLSPGHPVLVGGDAENEGGHLVPAMCLVNGTTVARVAMESVTYWHVELDEHDILLAEGLPAESYLDWGDRAFFSDAELHALANPDFVVPGLGRRCRPVALDGPVVEAERRRLDALFAASLAAQCAWEAADVVAS